MHENHSKYVNCDILKWEQKLRKKYNSCCDYILIAIFSYYRFSIEMSQIECSFRLHAVIDPMDGYVRSLDRFVVEWHCFGSCFWTL